MLIILRKALQPALGRLCFLFLLAFAFVVTAARLTPHQLQGLICLQGSSAEAQGYTEETLIVGRALQKDFEQRGVHLDAQGQRKALQMSQQIAVMGMQIGQSLLSAMMVCCRME